MSFNLRKRSHLSYYEPEEPSFDEYIYCEQCADFVYDYCAIHGPLLVVPDNKISMKPNHLSNIPRAALTIPDVFLHLAPSIIPDAGLGVFSTLTLPRGVRFGPYCGQRTPSVDSMYSWQIFGNNNKRLHMVDAADSDRSNWMRYVNCARHSKEQNLLAFQFRGQLYYRTIKIIPRHTELMVFYGSEFANALHINLKKYNSAKYYKDIISASSKSLLENKDDGIEEDYLPANQFHFIDEDIDDENSPITSKTSNVFSTKIDDSSNKIKEKQIKNDCTENISKSRHVCEICQKTYANSRNLQQHTLKHLNVWKYSCEFCLYKSNRMYNFKLHVGHHTNTYQYSCNTCPFKTNYKKNFKRHCLRHENNVEIIKKSPRVMEKACTICGFKTSSRKAFYTHKSTHKELFYKCDQCSYSNVTKYNLSRHIMRVGH